MCPLHSPLSHFNKWPTFSQTHECAFVGVPVCKTPAIKIRFELFQASRVMNPLDAKGPLEVAHLIIFNSRQVIFTWNMVISDMKGLDLTVNSWMLLLALPLGPSWTFGTERRCWQLGREKSGFNFETKFTFDWLTTNVCHASALMSSGHEVSKRFLEGRGFLFHPVNL